MITIAINKGIEIRDFEALLIEPDWSNPREALDTDGAVVAHPGLAREPVSPSDGKVLWRNGYRWRFSSRETMKEWIDHQRHGVGRVRSFWMPSWRSDFRLRQGLGPADSPCIFIRANGFEHVFEPGRYGVLVLDVTDRGYLYEITGYDAESAALVIRDELGAIVPLSTIALVSLVRRVRFDTSRFRWRFTTDRVAEVDANVAEVLEEGVFTL